MRPRKYHVKNLKFLNKCQYPKCKQRELYCVMCGYPGHMGFYMMNQKMAAVVIKHAHFIKEVDKGRNTWHKIGERPIRPGEIKYTPTINKRVIPEWIKEELA